MMGMEMMLKSMGLGNIIEMAQQLATDGTLQKIVKFAEDAGKMRSTLDKIERDYDRVCAKCGGEVEPGSSAGDAGTVATAAARPILSIATGSD